MCYFYHNISNLLDIAVAIVTLETPKYPKSVVGEAQVRSHQLLYL